MGENSSAEDFNSYRLNFLYEILLKSVTSFRPSILWWPTYTTASGIIPHEPTLPYTNYTPTDLATTQTLSTWEIFRWTRLAPHYNVVTPPNRTIHIPKGIHVVPLRV